MSENNTNILIVGMSKTGKTNFGGQLYGRLKSMECLFKLRETPDDLSLFDEIWRRLNEGLEGAHTSSKLHKTIILPVESKEGKHIDIVYPDYGGEQIRDIVMQRQISEIWQQQIRSSDHWFLFVRLDLIENISDITTKFYQQIAEDKDKKTVKIKPIIDLPEDTSAFYVELLQIFLYTKKVALSSPNKPQLTVLLSCWDKLNTEGAKPLEVLHQKMPLFSNFVKSNWHEEDFQIVGLSSLGKDLDKDKPDKEYENLGPERFGYLILPNGERETDITQILNYVAK